VDTEADDVRWREVGQRDRLGLRTAHSFDNQVCRTRRPGDDN
jgi:hypothetical protein